MKFTKTVWESIFSPCSQEFFKLTEIESKNCILRIIVCSYLETEHVFLLLWQQEHVKYSTPITWSSAMK